MTPICSRTGCREPAVFVMCVELAGRRMGREYDLVLCDSHSQELAFRLRGESLGRREWSGSLLVRDCEGCGGSGTREAKEEPGTCPECSGSGLHPRLAERAPGPEAAPNYEVRLELRREFDNQQQERRWLTSLATALGATGVTSRQLVAQEEVPF